MGRRAAACLGLLLLAMVCAESSAATTSASLPVVAVRLINHDPTLNAGLSIAQALVERLFRRAGLRIEWVPSASQGLRPLVFTVMISPSPLDQRDKDEFAGILGVSTSGHDGARGTFARIFGDRVRQFADAQALDVSSLLGCVITHELGHLLLPVNAHAQGGIMMPVWSPRLLPPYAPVPGFLSFQADLIRLRLTGQQQLMASTTAPPRMTN